MSNKLTEEMNKILKNPVADRHSLFQLKYFVVGKEPTHQAKLWRCMRELETRQKALNTIDDELNELSDRKELLLLEEPEEKPKIKEIKKRQLDRKLKSLDKSLEELLKKKKYIEEEVDFFIKSFRELEKIEPIKEYDDFKSQLEYWNEKLSQEVNLKLLLRQPLDLELTKTILALADEVPIKQHITKMLTEVHKKMLEMTAEKGL